MEYVKVCKQTEGKERVNDNGMKNKDDGDDGKRIVKYSNHHRIQAVNSF